MDIHEKVKQVIRQVFEAAALVHPEMKSDKSRAMYGVDVMLDSSFQPKILEVRLTCLFLLIRKQEKLFGNATCLIHDSLMLHRLHTVLTA